MRVLWLFGLSMCTLQWFTIAKSCSHKGQNETLFGVILCCRVIGRIDGLIAIR